MSVRAKKKHSTARFVGFMVAYAMFFAVITFGGARFFWNYLVDYQAKAETEQAEKEAKQEAYELSLPSSAIVPYIESFDEEHIHEVADSFINSLDSQLQSSENAFEQVSNLFKDGLTYEAVSASDTLVEYNISNPERVLGTVSFSFNGEIWSIDKETFNFDFLKGSTSVTVPYNYSVSCNGVVLDASYITESDIPFDILADFADYSDTISMPYLVTYTISEYIGQATFEVTDSHGNETDIPEDAPQDMFIDNYTQEEYDFVSEYISRYIPVYVNYASSNSGTRYNNLNALLQYILPGTSLEERVKLAYEGYQWGHSTKDVSHDLTINHLMVLSDNYYMADITYLVDTQGGSGIVTTTNNVRLIITVTDNGTFTVAHTNY